MPNHVSAHDVKLTTSNIKYLISLWELGAAERGIRSIDLARRLETSKPSTHAMVINLCDKGLAEKDKNTLLHLTADGAVLAADMARCYDALIDKLQRFLRLTQADCRDIACSILAQVQERLPEFEAAMSEI